MEKLQPAFSREQLSLPRAGGGGEVVVQDSNRVLRNTYWLLALSMLPTIAGAYVGIQFNFVRRSWRRCSCSA
jgi:FtsH-binding integral membrane protein